ncbi:PucR family transcriptional regulator [Streptomyces antnestii]|uniref:PucR family transcriptional regulator n=1 Tax=Streptomyces antnestii TaxID=2494256 RepID=A0A437NZI2_9ACTN|nr:helix-turn-helix domain-containing protein [Streptomyces sp. San01]RVU15377.1 PucR family transcriptional regulator [Streptomyces sp. San01]
MPRLVQLLTAPGLDTLRPLAGPLDATEVTGIRLEPRAGGLATVPAGTVAVMLTPLPDHLLDVAVRDAASAGAAALVLTGREAGVAGDRALRALAERGRIAVLTTDGDLAALVVAVDRAVAGDAADALARIEAAARDLPAAGGDPEQAAETAARLLGVPVERRAAGPGEEGASAAGPDGEVRLAAPARPGHAGTAVRTVLALAALTAAGGGHGDVPVRSRGHLLAELLVAPQDRTGHLAARGRTIGLPVDGRHIALRIEAAALPAADRYRLLDTVLPRTLTDVRQYAADGHLPDGVHWNAALVDDALVLLGTWPADPGAPGRRAALALARRAVDRLRRLHPEADLRGGVGAPHRGPLGIRTSAREARAALLKSAPADGTPVTAHDAAGLDRMLLEWYASDTAREAVDELLAPVTELGPERADPLLRTLQTYLDHNNSPAHAAEELHLHRNAVGARIRRVTDLTGADLTDPETRLALQLACRARLSTPPGPA